MRISDWSSDVCSSDLLPMAAVIELLDEYFETLARAINRHGGEILKFIGDAILAIFPLEEGRAGDARRACAASMAAATEALEAARQDRQSVVKGKSGYVRVGIGGHSSIKKKNTK